MQRTRSSRNPLVAYLVTLVELIIVALALYYAFTSSYVAMLAWTLTSAAYLTVGFFIIRARVLTPGRGRSSRVGLLGTLSWVLPFAASASGVNTAVIVLLNRSVPGIAHDDRVMIAVFGSVGIMISWVMLQTGFAHVYQASQLRDPATPGLVFPNSRRPGFVDFLYFAFVIGTSFATSDTVVSTQRMRLTVTVHGILSFFYNAMVVAIAFQVLQQLAAG